MGPGFFSSACPQAHGSQPGTGRCSLGAGRPTAPHRLDKPLTSAGPLRRCVATSRYSRSISAPLRAGNLASSRPPPNRCSGHPHPTIAESRSRSTAAPTMPAGRYSEGLPSTRPRTAGTKGVRRSGDRAHRLFHLLRVRHGSEWLEAEHIIGDFRTYEGQLPGSTARVCDDVPRRSLAAARSRRTRWQREESSAMSSPKRIRPRIRPSHALAVADVVIATATGALVVVGAVIAIAAVVAWAGG